MSTTVDTKELEQVPAAEETALVTTAEEVGATELDEVNGGGLEIGIGVTIKF